MNILIVLAILLAHWIADFIMQTNEQATGKSINNYLLTQHVGSYTAYMCASIGALQLMTGTFDLLNLAIFSVITFSCHWITDYFTSRLNTKLWKKGDTHNFFVSIGFDQWLHTVQLLLTYKLLF